MQPEEVVLKVAKGHGDGCYDLLLDGNVVGEVRKRERRYNLRRVYVERWWQADAVVSGFRFGPVKAGTRAAAVAGLAEAIEIGAES